MKKISLLIFLLYTTSKILAQGSNPVLTESAVTLKTLSGVCPGTLTVPNTPGKMPVVLIIPGNGPVDRDGNGTRFGLSANTYKLMAEALGKNGIASLRYDKRLIGQNTSTLQEDKLHFDDYIDDAIGLINVLSADKRFSKVIVLGHGEGSLVGILSSATESVKAFISVEGTGDPGDKLLTEQMKSQPQYLATEFKKLLDTLRKGKTDNKIDPSLYYIARPGIQTFLMTWCRFDPQKEIKKLKIPVLIVQGTTDLQVAANNAEKLKKAKLSTILMINNMNYVLKDAPADKDLNLATYNKPELPLKSELIPGLVNFINTVK